MEKPFAMHQQQAIPFLLKIPPPLNFFVKKDPLLVAACLAN
jgi:hypothetical protein